MTAQAKAKANTTLEEIKKALGETPKKDTDTRVECQCCDKPAKYNFQKTWLVATLVKGKNGALHFKDTGIPDNQDPTGYDNLFLCEEHALSQFDEQYQLIQRGEWKSI